LILLTYLDGVFNDDPKKNPRAELIHYRRRIGKGELKMAFGKSKTLQGTGGMYSKLLAADLASRAGIPTHLVRGDWPRNLLEIAAGRGIGTQIGGEE
ncbi:MAG: glutamate 5-kinase, partial [Bdellovibrionota bacterium]